MNSDDPIDPKFKKIAIDLVEFEQEDGGGSGTEEPDDTQPTLTLGFEAFTADGRQIRFVKEFSVDANRGLPVPAT